MKLIRVESGGFEPHTTPDKRCAGGGASLGGQCALSYTRQITEGSESYRGRHSPSGGRDECPGNVLVDSHTRALHSSRAGAAVSVAGTQRRPPPFTLAMFYCQQVSMAGGGVAKSGKATAAQSEQSVRGFKSCRPLIILASCHSAGFSLTFHAMQAGASNLIPVIKHVARPIFHLRCISAVLLGYAFVLSISASQAVAPVLSNIAGIWRGRHYHFILEVISQ